MVLVLLEMRQWVTRIKIGKFGDLDKKRICAVFLYEYFSAAPDSNINQGGVGGDAPVFTAFFWHCESATV